MDSKKIIPFFPILINNIKALKKNFGQSWKKLNKWNKIFSNPLYKNVPNLTFIYFLGFNQMLQLSNIECQKDM